MRISIRYFDFEEIPSIYEYQYPTDRELLEIFPEAKNIIPLKIDDWLRRKGKLLSKETIPFFRKCNALSDEFARAFWKEAYAYLAGGFNEIIRQLKRLRRLEALMADPERASNFEAKLQKAKNTPIIELYDYEGIRRAGRNLIARCPLHADKSPSFYIYDNNSWYCFGCNRGGDSIDFVRAVHNVSFSKALDLLTGGVKC